MCVPSLNEISETNFELLRTQVKTFGDGATDLKPVHPWLSSVDTSLLNMQDYYCKVLNTTTLFIDQKFP